MVITTKHVIVLIQLLFAENSDGDGVIFLVNLLGCSFFSPMIHSTMNLQKKVVNFINDTKLESYMWRSEDDRTIIINNYFAQILFHNNRA